MDINVPQQFRKIIDGMVEIARHNLKSSGYLMAVAFVGKAEPSDYTVIGCDTSDHIGLAITAKVIRARVVEVNADYVMTIIPAYGMRVSSNGRSMEQLAQEYDAMAKQYAGRLDQMPGRQEVIRFSLETPVATWHAVSPVVTVNGDQTFGEVDWTMLMEGNLGALSGFFPPPSSGRPN